MRMVTLIFTKGMRENRRGEEFWNSRRVSMFFADHSVLVCFV
ncbi:hypothetical protein RchiOBHm_Chr7g0233681 [Rosa chinensis]|uniref:Uncharacterized protein n=1 Tax=Rosa chinensis TaxID=74649 RepID=A0A2P6PG84_ROSCH|nr:hypothetical protein RchiOBHm_Chr7g0233681 [Rosa chinensis]